MAVIAGWVTLAATALVVLIALYVAKKAPTDIPGGYEAVYGMRKYYAWALIAGLVVMLGVTLPQNPYSTLLDQEPSLRLEVIGRMWSWEIRRPAGADEASAIVLPAGKIVEFAVTSEDVNHGFGIYDEKGNLLAQAQAMPGYVNHLRYVFDLPGRYHVVCLEYCGLIHHSMLAELEVQ